MVIRWRNCLKVLVALPVRDLPHCGNGESGPSPLWRAKFHPEVQHTPVALKSSTLSLKDVCRCQGLWTPDQIVEDIVSRVRTWSGDQRVILGLSGGVDSSVVAALLARAIGDQLTCVFVDNGLLRFEELIRS